MRSKCDLDWQALSSVNSKAAKELELKVSEITQQVYQGTYIVDESTTFRDVAKLWLAQYNAAMSQARRPQDISFAGHH